MNQNILDLIKLYSEDRTKIVKALAENLNCELSLPAILSCPIESLYETIAAEYERELFSGRWVLQFSEEDKLRIKQDALSDIASYCPTENLKVLDIGCGDNKFKSSFSSDQLIGIDPFNPKADVKQSLEEYAASCDIKFDAIIAHGSLNFGSKEQVKNNFKLAAQLLKPGGILSLRFNLGHLPEAYRYLGVQNEWINIFEVFTIIHTDFVIISRYNYNYKKSFNATLRKKEMYNLKTLYNHLADKEKTIETLEENLGSIMKNRNNLLLLSDEEFLKALSEEYKAIFFEKIWKGNLTEEQRLYKNGLIARVVSETYPSPLVPSILDIGCGFNHLRKYFPSGDFLGIDPNNDKADQLVSFEEFLTTNTRIFDVIICQGNLHFGTKDDVERNLQEVIKILKPGGFKSGGLLFVRFNVNKVPALYPYLDIVEDWKDYHEVVELFSKYIYILSDITIDNGHRIEFYGINK